MHSLAVGCQVAALQYAVHQPYGKGATSCCTHAGAVPGFSKGYVLYGKEGTLFVDLAAKKLQLGLQSEGGQLKDLTVAEGKKETWKVCIL